MCLLKKSYMYYFHVRMSAVKLNELPVVNQEHILLIDKCKHALPKHYHRGVSKISKCLTYTIQIKFSHNKLQKNNLIACYNIR